MKWHRYPLFNGKANSLKWTAEDGKIIYKIYHRFGESPMLVIARNRQLQSIEIEDEEAVFENVDNVLMESLL